ncbi:hypothetical protein ACS5PN_24580 [Roseateles sp. NT4]|uniref:hypothetical protein n=1 Tax=Roseateles sp. NT4 TaxID=3453715 RepID=UPI003EF02869
MVQRRFRFLLCGLLALALVAASLFALGLYSNRDRNSSFYLVDAELADAGYLDKLQIELQAGDTFRANPGFGFSAHRLKAGDGMVLAHRHFTGGSAMVTDDEGYQKLTVWLRRPVSLSAQQSLRVPEQGVVLLSSGGSAWPRNDCSAYIRGVVDVTPLGSEFKVGIHGSFEPRGIRDPWHPCKPREVALQFQASPIQLRDLSPWQGGAAAAHPYDETYAR